LPYCSILKSVSAAKEEIETREKKRTSTRE
jgi:hypothetical protein